MTLELEVMTEETTLIFEGVEQEIMGILGVTVMLAVDVIDAEEISVLDSELGSLFSTGDEESDEGSEKSSLVLTVLFLSLLARRLLMREDVGVVPEVVVEATVGVVVEEL